MACIQEEVHKLVVSDKKCTSWFVSRKNSRWFVSRLVISRQYTNWFYPRRSTPVGLYLRKNRCMLARLYLIRNRLVCIQEETRWFVSREKPDGLYPRTRPNGLMVCIQEETRCVVSRFHVT